MRYPILLQLRFWCIIHCTLFAFSAPSVLSSGETQRQETYVYSFQYLGLTVAEGTITISDTLMDDGTSGKYMKTRATSLTAASVLFRIDNKYSTLIDTATCLPLLYTKNIEQTNLSQGCHFQFDQKNLCILSAEGEKISLAAPTHNFFSALYYMMNHTFQPKEILRLPVYAAGNIWEVRAEALKTEMIATSIGTYRTVQVEIEFHRPSNFQEQTRKTDVLTNRLLQEDVKTYLWFSATENGVVVKAEYELFPAGLRMMLAGYMK